MSLRFKGLRYVLLGLFLILIPTVIIKADSEPHQQDKVIVGFYEYSPYYYIDENSQPAGYYHDLMELIAEGIGIEYEYLYVPLNECLEKLKNKEIDLLFGVGLSPKRQELYTFSKYYISIDKTALFTNHNIQYGDIKALNGLTIGAIENIKNYQLFLDYLSREEVNVKVKIVDSYKNTKKLLMDNEVDAILYSVEDRELREKYRTIYEFSSGGVYIATYNDNHELMDKINSYFEQYTFTKNNPISKLYDSYFNEYKKMSEVFVLIIIILILGIFAFALKRIWNKREIAKKRRKILRDLEQNKFLLYYQPIVNPHLNTIVGFESLLRYNNGSEIQSPYFFLSEIEEADMMYDVSMWILKQIMIDYNRIKLINSNLNKDFYISMNVSFKELQDSRLVNEVKEIIKSTDFDPNHICFEIVERFQLSDVDRIQKVILSLKNIGFKIAIDDFGVQYSNFDILETINYDVIKLDKCFIDEVESSFTKREIVKCMSNIATYNGKVMVIEGVESHYQLEMIKKLYNDSMYIQGYYYSKPLPIDEIKNLEIGSEL